MSEHRSSTVDTNVLLYASDKASPFHETALGLLNHLAVGPEPFYVFWPVAVAYAVLATDEQLFEHPLTEDQARGNIGRLLDREHVRAVGEEEVFWQGFADACRAVFLRGDFVAQGYLVAMMRAHGVSTLWTHDPQYRQFDGITVRDPFDRAGGGGARGG